MENKNLAPLKKVFDPEGTFRLRFATDDKKGFEKWIEEAGYVPEVCVQYAEVVDDEVFGRAYEFPCVIE